jgi:hypothetical protein
MPTKQLHPYSPPCVQKKVRLNSDHNTYIEAPIQDFDHFFAYYSKEEYEGINDEVKAAVKLMQLLWSESESFTSRGLRCKTPVGSRRKSSNRRKSNNRRRARQAVLEEQFREENESEQDADLLAEIYKGFTSHCLRQAQRTGTQDAAVARAISRETEEVCKDDYMTVSTVETYPTWSYTMLLASFDDNLSVSNDSSIAAKESSKKNQICKRVVFQLFQQNQPLYV